MFKDDLLAGKRALISGGGTGLGKAMGHRFMELGADLVICGRREEVLNETASELADEFGRAVEVHRCDIRDAEAVDAMVGTAFETAAVDILVNNAAGNILSRYETLSPRAIDAVLGIVLHGAAYLTLSCGKRWIEAGHKANVLSIVTTYAWTGSAYVVPSAMGKAGALALTRSLAAEWGPHGIRLNAIAPGPFPTKGAWDRLLPTEEYAREFETRMPLGRPGEIPELADLAAYLVSDGAGYITGEVVTIDGGEWIGNAGQFNLMKSMTDADWVAFRERQKGG
jgi:NAD(P)-dependent dehydrogenase (short-subunit alcohol dehydrogenase family)